jgi:hypothetical protein
MTTDVEQATAVLERRLLARALASGDLGALHVRFDAAVLARYRERGAKLVRTRSVGRVSMAQWSLDLGIAVDGTEVHLAARDLLERLPEAERAHWVEHLVPVPASPAFLQMALSPVACIDDGDTEAWD